MRAINIHKFKIILLLVCPLCYLACSESELSNSSFNTTIDQVLPPLEKIDRNYLAEIRKKNHALFHSLKDGKLTEGNKINTNTDLLNCKKINITRSLGSLEGIEELINVEELKIELWDTREVFQLKKLKNIKSITIDNSILKELPEFLFNFPKIEELNIYYSLLDSYDSISKLKNLKYICINKTNLDRVPELKDLSRLEVVNLKHNIINNFLTFDNFNPNNLKEIDLSYNYIKSAVPMIDLSKFAKLENLRLKENRINDYSNLKKILDTKIKLDIKKKIILGKKSIFDSLVELIK